MQADVGCLMADNEVETKIVSFCVVVAFKESALFGEAEHSLVSPSLEVLMPSITEAASKIITIVSLAKRAFQEKNWPGTIEMLFVWPKTIFFIKQMRIPQHKICSVLRAKRKPNAPTCRIPLAFVFG